MLNGSPALVKHKFMPQDCRSTETGKEGMKKQGDRTHHLWVLVRFTLRFL